MVFKEFLILAKEASKGNDSLSQGAIGSNGYGFVFRDLESMSNYADFSYFSKLFSLGTSRRFIRRFKKDEIKEGKDLFYDIRSDIPLIGFIKTLVPNMRFGGFDILFNVWVFAVTPNDKRFMFNIYYGPTQLAIGAWDYELNKRWFEDAKDFPNDLKAIMNFNPFEFEEHEKEALAEATELRLKRIPVSDFYGVVGLDMGYEMVGIRKKDKRPFTMHLERDNLNKV